MSTFDLDALLSRSEACPSEFALDSWLAGELQGTDAAQMRAHCDGCEPCGAYVATHARGLAAIPGLDADAMFAQILRGAEARPEVAPAAPARERPSLGERLRSLFSISHLGWVAAAGAAAVALFVLRARPPAVDPDGDPGLRMKGTLALEVVRKTPEGAQVMVSDDAFDPSDEIRFVITTPTAGRVAVVGVEASGALYPAWPLPDHHANPVRPAGKAQALEGAVQLDGKPGRETLYLVLCPEAVEPECASAGADQPPHCAEGCRSTAFVVRKSAP